MSHDPPNRHNRPGGGKIYRHPITGEEFDSVTSALDLFDKDGLKRWAASQAADAAFELLPQLTVSVLEPDCGNSYNRCYQKHGRDGRCGRCPCGRCERCVHRRVAHRHDAESSRRADEGTEVHSMINQWVLNGGIAVASTPAAQPYFRTFLRWVADYGLVPNRPGQESSWVQTEATLLNREHRYAGTSDAAVWIRRVTPKANEFIDEFNRYSDVDLDSVLVRVDYKTREKPKETLYNDMPLQGEAYERCSVVMLPDGSEYPAPRTMARCVLQLRPDLDEDGNKAENPYTFKPMLSGDRTFRVFLGLLEAYRWINDFGTKKAFGLEMLNPAVSNPAVVEDLTALQMQRSLEQVRAKALPPATAKATVDVELPAEPIDRWDPVPADAAATALQEAVAAADNVPFDLPGLAAEPPDDFDDPWADTPPPYQLTNPWPALEQAGFTVEPVDPPPFDPPYRDAAEPQAQAPTFELVKASVTFPPEQSKPAKKTPAKKATTRKAAEPNGSTVVEKSLREQAGRWPVGAPATHLLDEDIPF